MLSTLFLLSVAWYTYVYLCVCFCQCECVCVAALHTHKHFKWQHGVQLIRCPKNMLQVGISSPGSGPEPEQRAWLGQTVRGQGSSGPHIANRPSKERTVAWSKTEVNNENLTYFIISFISIKLNKNEIKFLRSLEVGNTIILRQVAIFEIIINYTYNIDIIYYIILHINIIIKIRGVFYISLPPVQILRNYNR